jgi:hypothetical protein
MVKGIAYEKFITNVLDLLICNNTYEDDESFIGIKKPWKGNSTVKAYTDLGKLDGR